MKRRQIVIAPNQALEATVILRDPEPVENQRNRDVQFRVSSENVLGTDESPYGDRLTVEVQNRRGARIHSISIEFVGGSVVVKTDETIAAKENGTAEVTEPLGTITLIENIDTAVEGD